jgi:hypothetical protein
LEKQGSNFPVPRLTHPIFMSLMWSVKKIILSWQ